MRKSFLSVILLLIAAGAVLGMTGCSSEQGGADETTAVTTTSTTAETTAETTEATTAAETEPVFEVVSDEEAERIHAYLHIFAQYYNSPYKQGDEIKSRAPVYLSALYLLRYADEYDFIQLDEGNQYTVSGENMLKIIHNLVGDYDISFEEYINDGTNIHYDADTDTVTVLLGTDYWGGGMFYLDNDSEMTFTRSGDTVKADVTVVQWFEIGSDETVSFKYEYTFDRIEDDGHIYYRIVSIEPSEAE